MRIRFCLFVFWLAALGSCTKKEQPADLILSGGVIYTMNSEQPKASAVAVRGDSIVYVGDEKGAQAFRGDHTRLIPLNGLTVTPGLIESHGHMMGLGYQEMVIDLSGVTSFEEIVAKVKQAADHSEPGKWIVGRGWHQDKWNRRPVRMVKGFPTHEALSSVSPDNPVILIHASGHAALANAKAMRIAGVNPLVIEKLTKDLGEGGEVIRDELGNPTGIFNERAQTLITRHLPPRNPETDSKALELAMDACLRNGITSFHDAGEPRAIIEMYERYNKENKLRTRMYAMLEIGDPAFRDEWYHRGPEINPRGFLTVRAIKLHCDGALGTRGAWLLDAYEDRPGYFGMATLPMDTVLKVSREALRYGFQVCSHAIGDRANREVLDQYEKALKEFPGDHRFRIEHAQHLSPADLPRFAKLGVVASMQAIHMSSDRPWAPSRLGEKRVEEGAYRWQSLIRSGAKVINGTDVPVEPINPIACFFSSVTRQTLEGKPEGGYEPSEKMTREQALRSYTLDAAYGAFEEHVKGSIEPGKLADFTVLSQDIMSVPDAEILKTKVMMTVVGAKVLYER